MTAIRQDFREGWQQSRRQRNFRGSAERADCITFTIILASVELLLPLHLCRRIRLPAAGGDPRGTVGPEGHSRSGSFLLDAIESPRNADQERTWAMTSW